MEDKSFGTFQVILRTLSKDVFDVFCFSTGSAFLHSWAVDLSIFSGKHPEGGSTWEFVVEMCCLFLQILTLFQTKIVIFYTLFQTWPLKSIPVF